MAKKKEETKDNNDIQKQEKKEASSQEEQDYTDVEQETVEEHEDEKEQEHPEPRAVARYKPQTFGVDKAQVSDSRLAQLIDHKIDSEELMNFARSLVKSGIVPVNSPEKAIIIMQKGRELGFPPMASFEHIVVINDKPSLDGAAMQTKLAQAGVEWETLEDDVIIYDANKKPIDRRTTIEFYRRSRIDPTRILKEKVSFKFTDAAVAELTKKDNWKRYRKSMLWWRTFAIGARRIASDAIMGMYSPEELDSTGKVYIDEEGRTQYIR